MSSPAIGAALQYAIDQLGGPLVENDSNPTVGNAVNNFINGNGDRVGLVIVNLGANDLFISIDSGVSSTNGIKLAALGGNVTLNLIDDLTLPTRAWYGIAPTGNTSVFVLEMFRVNLATKKGQQ
jgi:hypothetical protein